MLDTTGTRPLSWYGDHAQDWLWCAECWRREDECNCEEESDNADDAKI